MNLAQKKPNPLEVAIALIGELGEPEIPIGKTTLSVVHIEDGKALLFGALLNHSGKRIGKVEIDGFPADHLPETKPVGAPRKDEKRLAILLAWSIKNAESGGKMGIADEKLVESGWFKAGCSASGKVRKVRNDLAKEIGLDLDKGSLHITSEESQWLASFSLLIKKPTIYATESGGVEILGIGDLWHECLGERVLQGKAFKIELDSISGDLDPSGSNALRGPIIISNFRPGQ